MEEHNDSEEIQKLILLYRKRNKNNDKIEPKER